MTWQQVKDNMMVNDPKKAEIYNNMIEYRDKQQLVVNEIVACQMQLTSILFLINDHANNDELASALPHMGALRTILEKLEATARDKLEEQSL